MRRDKPRKKCSYCGIREVAWVGLTPTKEGKNSYRCDKCKYNVAYVLRNNVVSVEQWRFLLLSQDAWDDPHSASPKYSHAPWVGTESTGPL